MSVTKEVVTERLRSVSGPDFSGNIVDLGMLSEIFIADGKVFFSITVPAERADHMEPLRAAAERVVKAIPGVTGAVVASTCFSAPLVLLTLGISGAWIGTLTALEPYKPYFAVVALIFIGLGFRQVYFKAKPVCVDGSYCAKPQSALITKTALWIATV